MALDISENDILEIEFDDCLVEFRISRVDNSSIELEMDHAVEKFLISEGIFGKLKQLFKDPENFAGEQALESLGYILGVAKTPSGLEAVKKIVDHDQFIHAINMAMSTPDITSNKNFIRGIESGQEDQKKDIATIEPKWNKVKNSIKLLSEAEYRGRKVSLGKPFLTPDGPKKRSVYVKNAKGNVVKVNFGDKKLRIKKSNPKRRKSFRARHNCANPGPRWSARYWSCRMW